MSFVAAVIALFFYFNVCVAVSFSWNDITDWKVALHPARPNHVLVLDKFHHQLIIFPVDHPEDYEIVAGNGINGSFSDEKTRKVPYAINIALNDDLIGGLAAGEDGNLFFSERDLHRILMIEAGTSIVRVLLEYTSKESIEPKIAFPTLLHHITDPVTGDRLLFFLEEKSCNIKSYSIVYDRVSMIVEGHNCLTDRIQKPAAIWANYENGLDLYWSDEILHTVVKYEVQKEKFHKSPIQDMKASSRILLSASAYLSNRENAAMSTSTHDPSQEIHKIKKNDFSSLGITDDVPASEQSWLFCTKDLQWNINIGIGTKGSVGPGNQSPALSAQLDSPSYIWAYNDGTRYLTDNLANYIYQISGSDDSLTDFAGNGNHGYNGDDIPATAASLYCPTGIWSDSLNNLYFSDACNYRIRKISSSTDEQIITTVAGTGVKGTTGDGKNATSATLNSPSGIWGDSIGNIYFTEVVKCVIRKINSTGQINLLQGEYSVCGFNGDNIDDQDFFGNDGTSVAFNKPKGLFVDMNGFLYVADSSNNLIRMLIGSLVRTIAGNRNAGYSGDNGPPLSASLNSPRHMVIDSNGYIYISDSGNNVIRALNPEKTNITTLSGQDVSRVSPDDDYRATSLLSSPTGLFLNTNGELYIVDTGHYQVRLVTVPSPTSQPSGAPTNEPTVGPTSQPTEQPTLFPTCVPSSQPTSSPSKCPISLPTNIPSSQPSTDPSNRPSSCPTSLPTKPTPMPSVQPSRLPTSQPSLMPSALPTCQPSTKPSGGPSTAPSSQPSAVPTFFPTSPPTAEPSLFPVAFPTGGPTNRPLTMVPTPRPSKFPSSSPSTAPTCIPSYQPTCKPTSCPSGQPSTSPSSDPSTQPSAVPTTLPTRRPTTEPSSQPSSEPSSPSSQPSSRPTLQPAGNSLLFTSENIVWDVVVGNGEQGAGENNVAPTAATMMLPVYVWVSSNKTIYITDNEANRIYSVRTKFDLFAGTGTGGYNGDSIPSLAAELNCPAGIWGDSFNNLYFADSCNYRVRKINVNTNIISTFAGTGAVGASGDGSYATLARFQNPVGLWGNSNGDLYVSDIESCVIRVIDAAGIINLVGGQYESCGYTGEGDATSILFNKPRGLFVSWEGSLYISDTGNNRIRVISSPSNTVTTVVGQGLKGYSGDGGQATAAALSAPRHMWVDTNGDMYITDSGNNVVRIVSVKGIITTLSGQGVVNSPSSGGDDDYHNPNALFLPVGLFLLPSGELYVVDSQHYVLRSVTVATPGTLPTTAPTLAFQTSLYDSPSYVTKNSFAFAAWDKSGRGYVWGGGPQITNVSSIKQLVNVTMIVPGKNAFVAIKVDHSIFCWGAAMDIDGWWNYIDENVLEVFTTEHAFAAINKYGAVLAFGSAAYGGVIPEEFGPYLSTNVTSIVATAAAFCALRMDGTVYAWGNSQVGGSFSSFENPELCGVTRVFANRGAFAALKSDNTVITWGSCAYGGCMSEIQNVSYIFASNTVFVGVLRNGSLITWGNGLFGGDSSSVGSELYSVRYLSYSAGAFAAVLSDQGLLSWGNSLYGGDSSAVTSDLHNIVNVIGNDRAFAALTASGSVVVWGDAKFGGVIEDVKIIESLSGGVESIAATQGAFAALKSDGSVVTWGQAAFGGNSSSVAEFLTSGVYELQSVDGGFLAVKTDNTVIGWVTQLYFLSWA